MHSVLSLSKYFQIEKWLEAHVGPDNSKKKEEHE